MQENVKKNGYRQFDLSGTLKTDTAIMFNVLSLEVKTRNILRHLSLVVGKVQF